MAIAWERGYFLSNINSQPVHFLQPMHFMTCITCKYITTGLNVCIHPPRFCLYANPYPAQSMSLSIVTFSLNMQDS